MKLLSYWFCMGFYNAYSGSSFLRRQESNCFVVSMDSCLRRNDGRFFVLQKFLVVACIFFMTACSSPTKIEQPDIQYASAFTYSDAQTTPTVIDQTWWTYFQSEKLNQLMQSANQQSLDLLIVAERVRQAELQLKIANASWFPTLNAKASSGERNSEDLAGVTTINKSTDANISFKYEVDLWGGIAATRRADKARANADLYDQVAAALSVRAAIASGWFDYLALQERIATTKKNIAIAENIQRIVEAKYKNGAANAGEVAQQKTNLLNQQASLLPLQLQAKQAASALAILLGQSPLGFTPWQENLLSINVPEIFPETPAELIVRRPDVATSEAKLVAAKADVVQARAALLPGVSFSASAGKSASELFSLNPATSSHGWALELTQALFSGGSIWNKKRINDSLAAELLLQYHKSILVALQEVDDTLASAEITKQQEISQQEIVKQAELSLRLAETRYRQGSDELITLLDAQRSFAQAQDALVQQRLSRLKTAVNLYKALGGGWNKP
jgi:outer membrane protein, multidrug efflux system